MKGLINGLSVMIALLGIAGFLWVASNVDQWLQKKRGIQADEFGRRPDGWLGKGILGFVIVGGLFWYFSTGGAHIDPEFSYRR